MKEVIAAVGALVLAVGVTVWGQTPSAKLTDTETLRLQVHTLQVAVAQRDLEIAQLRAQLAQVTLTAEREAIGKTILASRPGMEIDWQKLELKPVAPTPK